MSNFVDRFFTTGKPAEDANRRTAMRTQLLQFVELRLDQEIFGNATSLDISTTGMRVQCLQPLELGTSIFLMFRLPGDGGIELEIQGEYTVIHCQRLGNDWMVGLRAYHLPDAARLAIDSYINKSQSASTGPV